MATKTISRISLSEKDLFKDSGFKTKLDTDFGAKQKDLMIPLLDTGSKQTSKLVSGLKLESTQTVNQEQLLKQFQAQAIVPKFATSEAQLFKQAQEQKLIQLQPQVQKQRLKLDFGDSKLDSIIGKLSEEKRKKKKGMKQIPTYALFQKRKGKFRAIGMDFTRSEALKLGSERTLTSLSRTFKIRPTGKAREIFAIDEEIMPREEIFRQYKIKKGKQYFTPDQFIQKTNANLQTIEEKAQLKESRRLKKLMNF
jgi:hypothetical protein